MRRLLPVILTGLGLAAAATDLPEAYQGILRRNVFDSRREPFVPRDAHAAPVVPAVPPDRMTLLGVAVVDGRAVALFSGSSAEFAGTRRPGETLGSGRVVTIDTGGVTFEADQVSTLRIRVGQTLSRAVGQAWQVSESPAPPTAAPAAPPSSASGATTEGAPASASPGPGPVTAAAGAAPADILKQMLERRKRELTP